MTSRIAFVGGGNMARAIIGGLIDSGWPAQAITVIEPHAPTAAALERDFAIAVQPQGDATLAEAACVVWAVKPQVLKEVALALRPLLGASLHLSIAAGVTTQSLLGWLASARIVRAMPNTPALIRKGMTGLFAAPSVSEADRQLAQRIAQAVGQVQWVGQEALLDAVTAISGSGPAYVFYFLEAMQQAGESLGLTREQAYRLAVATFEGAAALAAVSDEPPEVLRQRVTSKGGTTFAATSAMDACDLQAHFMAAIQASSARAAEMAREFG
ncbi:MAG: pyrroline-5-carboxylate reductase [Comamonadaceae bacterium]|nr:pyrroline-5-carboxylate reductase [Comamonadaceae bacterium]